MTLLKQKNKDTIKELKMKKQIILVLISVLFLSCKKEKKTEVPLEVKSVVVSNFLKDVNSLIDVKNPIKQFQEAAVKLGTKKIEFNKDNIAEVLKEAENYDTMVIVVLNHTIVKVDSIKKCKSSGSWSVCMPYAKGFVKKGELIYIEDYCNNIIGRADSQKRTAYFFK